MSNPQSENRNNTDRRSAATLSIRSLSDSVVEQDLHQHDWYNNMIIDCTAAIKTGVANARWSIIVAHHAIGLRILEEQDGFERTKTYGHKIVQRVAKSLNMSQRTIAYCIQFAKEYPTERSLETLPGGMNISWHKITNKLLQGKPIENDCTHKEFVMARICKGCNCRLKD